MGRPRVNINANIAMADPAEAHKNGLIDKIRRHKEGLRDKIAAHESGTDSVKKLDPSQDRENNSRDEIERINENIAILWDLVNRVVPDDDTIRDVEVEYTPFETTEDRRKKDSTETTITETGPAFQPYYFQPVIDEGNALVVHFNGCWIRIGKSVLSLSGSMTTSQTIPSSDGSYTTYFKVSYDPATTFYSYSLYTIGEAAYAPISLDDEDSVRIWITPILRSTVTSGAITTLQPIWPGHLMSIEGRIV